MEYLLPSGQLSVCQGHDYLDNHQRDPHQVSIVFMAYTQANVKSDIFMELPICFVVEGFHPI